MAVRILTDEDEGLDYIFDQSDDSDAKHGDGYEESRKKQLKPVFIPERRIEQMKESFDCVVVNDFGDEYHLSEEERIAKNKFYQAFKTFSKCKHKYRKLDEYVSAMREALKCLEFVAENNGIYDSEKFKKMYFQDKIYINGLKFPKYSGRDKKNLSWEFLTDFILSEEDPENVLPKNNEEVLSDEELDALGEQMFDQKELRDILREETKHEEYQNALFFDVEEDSQDGKNIVVFLDRKQNKKLIKANPEFLYEMKEMKRNNRSLDHLARFVCDICSDDIESIAKYDKEHNIASPSDIPEFTGDIMNDDDYNRYLMQLEEYEDTQLKNDYHGRLKTNEQIRELELKELLEKNNWNIRNLYENKERDEKLKRIQKKEKQREKELKKKLVDVQNRRRRRMGEDVEEPAQKKGKSKKKKVKTKRPESKEIKRLKKDAKENMDEFLLGAAGQMTGDFKDYKEETMDWSWDNILKGGK